VYLTTTAVLLGLVGAAAASLEVRMDASMVPDRRKHAHQEHQLLPSTSLDGSAWSNAV
jgi:hypothetical protein